MIRSNTSANGVHMHFCIMQGNWADQREAEEEEEKREKPLWPNHVDALFADALTRQTGALCKLQTTGRRQQKNKRKQRVAEKR